MSETTVQTTRINKTCMTLGGVALVAGIILALVGAMSGGGDPHAFQHGYFFGWTYWACMAFGCFGVSLLHHAARGHWGFPVVRIFEAGGGPITLAVFFAALIPVIFGWREIFYPWADAARVAVDPVLQHRAPYFGGFFAIRYVIYAGVFILLSLLNQNWLRQEERTGDDRWWKKRQYWGGLFLVVYVILTNFMWTDWMMSMYDHWYSTIYGVWIMVGSALLAFAFTGIVLGTQYDKVPYKGVVVPWLTKDIGNWMLTFTMVWAYFSLSQYLIIWSGNLPEFTKYFIDRSLNGWIYVGWSLIVIHFFVPFISLLSPTVKRQPWRLALVGAWILFVRLIDVWFVVTPTWKTSIGINAVDIGMFLFFGGVWMLLFGWRLAQAPLITTMTPRLKEAVDHA